MMTLLPIAAFAADDNPASLGWSQIYADDDYVDAGKNRNGDWRDVAEFTVELKDADGDPTKGITTGSTLVVWAERANEQVSDVDTFVKDSTRKATEVVELDTLQSGKAIMKIDSLEELNKVYLVSSKAGAVKIKAAIVDLNAVGTDFQGKIVEENSVQIRDTATTEFEAVRTDWDVEFVPTKGHKDVEEKDGKVIGVTGGNANGIDKVEFDLFVKNDNNAVVGEKVKLSVNKNGATLDTKEEITDKRGKIEFGVTATKNDTYRITADVGGDTYVVNVKFGAADAYQIEISDQPTAAIALDTDPGIEFKLLDIQGNLIEEIDQDMVDKLNRDDKYHTVISKPSGSKLEDKDLRFEVGATTVDGDKIDQDILNLKFNRNPDKVGSYKVKAALENGKFVEVAFEVKEQGKITKIELDIKENRLAWGKSTNSPTVKLFDADGTYKKETNLDNFNWTVDNTALATIDTGIVKAKNGKDYNYKTGTVTVTVLDQSRNLTATDTVVIGSDVASVKVVDAGKAKVGEKATVKLQVVDADGNNIALDAANRNTIDVDVYQTSAPADAKTDWNLPIKTEYQKTLSRTGELEFTVTSDVVGKVGFQVVIEQTGLKDAEEKEANVNLSIPVTVDFTATAPETAAKQVTLLIGSGSYIVDGVVQNTDVAPFIRDNRTFVPVRVLATALGCDNEDTMWDPATETVKLVREDMTATAVIGSSAITVEKDGVTTTITSDVAPFIKDGRTVLPFRVLSEIFGAEVEAQYAADGTTASVTYSLD